MLSRILKNKIISSASIIFILFAVILNLSFPVLKAYAYGETVSEELKKLDEEAKLGEVYLPGPFTPSSSNKTQNPCLPRLMGGDGFNAGDCILLIGANITQYFIYTPAKIIFGAAGVIMNKSIDISIVGSIFSDLAKEGGNSGKNSAIIEGWTLTRDMVNLFLIFILLYIAIATILQLSGYGAKELLATLIIIAFLVNFSLVITRMIIDASNVLAIGFYNRLTENGGVSEVFKKAFEAGNILQLDDKTLDFKNRYTVEILTFTMGGAILFIASFIFLVFAVLFIIRMVVLLILMVFSPLAFAAMILPATKNYAKKWWDTLFSQAFFAPAALFMLWLSAKVANSSFIKDTYNTNGESFSAMLIDAGSRDYNWDNIAKFILQFITIGVLLCASLIVAKQMGAYGADATTKGLQKGLSKVGGYAGSISRRYAQRYAGGVAERMASGTEKTGVGKRFGTLARRIPFVTHGLAKISTGAKEEVGSYEKKYDAYSTGALKNVSTQVGTNRAEQIAIMNVLTKRGDIKDQGKFKGDYMKGVMENMKARGMSENIKNIERLRPEIAGNMNDAVKSQRAEDIPKLQESLAGNGDFIKAAIKYYKSDRIQKLAEIDNAITKAFIEKLKSKANGSEHASDIADAIRNENPGAARYIETNLGMGLLGFKPGLSKESEKGAPSLIVKPEKPTLGATTARTIEQQNRMEEIRRTLTKNVQPPPVVPPTATTPISPPPPITPPSPTPTTPPLTNPVAPPTTSTTPPSPRPTPFVGETKTTETKNINEIKETTEKIASKTLEAEKSLEDIEKFVKGLEEENK